MVHCLARTCRGTNLYPQMGAIYGSHLLYSVILNSMDMKRSSIFGDKRLDKEYTSLVMEMSASGSAVINRAYDKASTKKAAYRFINNDNVTVRKIADDLVCQSVANVVQAGFKEVLVAQDTMETVREGVVRRLQKKGRTVLECANANKGMRTHSAIILDAETGVPAGFGYLKIWGRQPKPLAEVKEADFRSDRKLQPSYYITDPQTGKTRYKYNVPITQRDSESSRWIDSASQIRERLPKDVHIIMVQDREGDMYPLLTLPSELENTDIVVRASKKRTVILEDGTTRDIFGYTASVGETHPYAISVGKGPRKKARCANVELRYGKIRIRRPHSPLYPQKCVDLCFVRVSERRQDCNDAEPVDWLLLTSIPVRTVEDALKIVSYYRRRWFIEDFHRLLKKKGFGIEDIQVESPHAFEINLALCIKSAYEVALIKKGFDSQDNSIPATMAFTPLEMQIVSHLNDRFNPANKIYRNPYEKGSLAWAAWAVACEGGWSAMPSQPKPGIITFKRGIDRIQNIYQYLLETQNNPICG